MFYEKPITREEAKRLYQRGETVHIGVFNKKDGGAWWNIETFVPSGFESHTAIAFESAARYFHLNYCPQCRTRYALPIEE